MVEVELSGVGETQPLLPKNGQSEESNSSVSSRCQVIVDREISSYPTDPINERNFPNGNCYQKLSFVCAVYATLLLGHMTASFIIHGSVDSLLYRGVEHIKSNGRLLTLLSVIPSTAAAIYLAPKGYPNNREIRTLTISYMCLGVSIISIGEVLHRTFSDG